MKIKFILLSILTVVLATSVSAQNLYKVSKDIDSSEMTKEEKIDYIYKTDKFSDNTYANFMLIFDLNVNRKFNLGYRSTGIGLQYGKWFSPYSAVQLGFAQGVTDDYNVSHFTLDYIVNFSNIVSYREDRRFSVLPFVGLEVGYLNSHSFTPICPGINIGGQLRYRASNRLDVIAEGRTSLSVESRSDGSLSWCNFTGVKIGLSYKFNKGKKSQQASPSASQTRAHNLYAMQDAYIVPVDSIVTNKVGIIDVESSDIAAIDLEFKEYSSYLDATSKEIISIMAMWLVEQKDGKIEIISFNDKGSEANLADRRNSAIYDEFIKNGVSKDDLKIIPAKDNEYKFNYPANAVVVFTPNK